MNFSFALIHPLLVHFPVGLLFTGVLFETYGKLRSEPAVERAGAFNLRLGYFFIFPAMGAGLLGLSDIEMRDSFRDFINKHILFAFSSLFAFSLTLLASRFLHGRMRKILYTVFSFVGFFCILATGYFGGELAHRFDLPLQLGLD
jgi:uncharacterized membrane protein